MSLLPRLAAPAALALLVLAGCAPGGSGGSGSGSDGQGGPGGGGLDCSGVSDSSYELFVDPRLEVDPALDVYPLGSSGDTISFTDTPVDGAFTTYSYSLAYIDGGSAFPNSGQIFVGAEDTNTFELEGPIEASGITGGPYAAFVDIEATTDAGTTVIGRLCVTLAAG